MSYAPPRKRHAPVVRILTGLVLLVVLIAGFGAWRVLHTTTAYASSHFNTGTNAVWLEHAWAGQPHTAAEYDALAASLSQRQMAYVYVHVGPLDSDGTIPVSRSPYAAQFVRAMHARLPQLKVLAWIGQLETASGAPASQVVDLANSQVRANIATTAARFARSYGYDGVHYDIEPITNNNARFLDLLGETRQQLPAGALISVSGQKWAPNAHLADWAYSMHRGSAWWTSYYYASIAAHVDQIAVMTYDTGMPTAALYSVFVKEEVEHILEAAQAAQHPPQVLFGVPTYAGDNPWFHSSAENMGTALTGITEGLNSTADTHNFTGVAIYRFAVTSDAAWTTYDQRWLGK